MPAKSRAKSPAPRYVARCRAAQHGRLSNRLRMTPDPTTTSDQRYAAFRHGAFLRFWAARFLATFSTQIVSVAVGWQIYDLTRDPFDLGLVGIIQFLPALLLVLVTGAVADRFGRRLIMALVELASRRSAPWRSCCLTWRGLTGAGPIFAVLALFGVARAFFGPASASLVANLVPHGGFRQRGRLEFVGLADRNHRRPGRRRPALRAFGRDAPTASPRCSWLSAALLVLSIPKPAQRSRPTSRRSTRCLPASATSGARRSCSARSRSTCSPCCLSGAVGAAAGLCARHPGARTMGPRPAARRARHRRDRASPSGWPAIRSATMPASSCCLRRAVRRLHRRCSASRPSPGCRSSRSPCSAPPTWSASMCARR